MCLKHISGISRYYSRFCDSLTHHCLQKIHFFHSIVNIINSLSTIKDGFKRMLLKADPSALAGHTSLFKLETLMYDQQVESIDPVSRYVFFNVIVE